MARSKRIAGREQCPKCAAEGRDTAMDNLTVFEDGGAFCVAGHGYMRTAGMEKDYAVSKISVSEIATYPIGGDPDRGVHSDVITMYNVRVSHDETTGVVSRVYYPYYDSSSITGYKIRNLPKKFMVAGKLSGFFGQQLCPKTPKASLYITEGEEDALALKTMFMGSRWAESDIVAMPNGANFDKEVQSQVGFLSKYNRIILCLDNDEPGTSCAKKMAGWLSGFVDDIRVVKLPLKDASDCLKAGLAEEVKAAIKGTQKYRPDGIIHGSEISVSDIMRAVPVGYSTPFPDLDEKLKGVRKGEIVTVCAGSGIGKSTLVREIGYHLVAHHNLTVCHIALEDVVESTAGAYIAMDNNVPSSLFRTKPSILPVGKIEASMDRIVRKMYFFSHFGSIDSGEFKARLLYYARAGVDFIILDHLSMVISGSDVQNERKEIDKIMTDLASMVVGTGVGLINVVHLKRRESRDSGKSLNEGGSVSLTDLRGSAALEQLSWSVIAMERDQQAEDGSEDFSEIRILKNRTWGRTGKAGKVKYEHKTGRLVHVPTEVTASTAVDIDVPEEKVCTSEKESSSKEHDDILSLI